MENRRSSLATWVENNSSVQAASWAPNINLREDGVRKFDFHASKDFELCLMEISTASCWAKRYLQMRLLWELQNNLHSRLPDGGLSPNHVEDMLLCILSFPAICADASEIEQQAEILDADGKGNFLLHKSRRENAAAVHD